MATKKRHATRVLIAGASSEAQQGLRKAFDTDLRFTVVGETSSSTKTKELAITLKPSLITLDLRLSRVPVLKTIEYIMANAATRILVLSDRDPSSEDRVLYEALSRGALDLLPKPNSWSASDRELSRFLDRCAELSTIPVIPHFRIRKNKPRLYRHGTARTPADRYAAPLSSIHQSHFVVVLGASTGGPRALMRILSPLPKSFPAPIVVVQHMHDTFADGFVQWLNRQTMLTVQEASPGTHLLPGHVYVAVRGPHIAVASGQLLRKQAHRNAPAPAIDVLFHSAARNYGPQSLAILLTGMGRDGAKGLKSIHDSGGTTFVQDRESCTVFGMPKAAIELGAVQRVVPIHAMATLLTEEMQRESVRRAKP